MAQQLLVTNILYYLYLKQVLLQWVGHTPEQHHQHHQHTDTDTYLHSLYTSETQMFLRGRTLEQCSTVWDVHRIAWVLRSAPYQEDREDPTTSPIGRIYLGDFPLEQTQEKTSGTPLTSKKFIDGQWVQPNIALAFPSFTVIKELYQVMHYNQTKEETTRLLVSTSHQEMLFQVSHHDGI